MDEVDMDKLIDLVEMAHKRVNLNINGVNVQRLLQREDSEHIRKNIEDPRFDEQTCRHDSILLKMIRIDRAYLVKELCREQTEAERKLFKREKTKTDLMPKPF